jgi:uncharacterized repeat protein (TIGR03803 family)
VLYNFCAESNCTDGSGPATGLTYAGAASGAPYDGTSPLFGTTEFYGKYDRGVVFKLVPRRSGLWREHVLHAFCTDMDQCPGGDAPRVPLYVDASGSIFGATETGGKGGGGVVFQLAPDGSRYTFHILHDFCAKQDCVDGQRPFSGLVPDGAGNLIGSTTSGGNVGKGLLYRLSPAGSGWSYSELTTFDDNSGMQPADLMMGQDGAVYGTTADGGTGFAGTIFRYDGQLETLYSFCPRQRHCVDGNTPDGLVEDASGNLFTAALSGGFHNRGTLIELSP